MTSKQVINCHALLPFPPEILSFGNICHALRKPSAVKKRPRVDFWMSGPAKDLATSQHEPPDRKYISLLIMSAHTHKMQLALHGGEISCSTEPGPNWRYMSKINDW